MTGLTPQARKLLLNWYATAKRDLPWRRTRDPYRILVSEVMLQQTRVTTVLPYYKRFLAQYPAAEALAAAPEQEVLALWSGLGYYSRARNLQKAAQVIARRGTFPDTYEQIRGLPGVGDYTAAAVASICFGAPRAVLDGNVLRVMSRFLAERGDIKSKATRARIGAAAQRLLDPANPAGSNQALMELGATVCLPRNPLCDICPWSAFCEGRKQGLVRELPVTPGRRQTVQIQQTLLVVRRADKVLLRQRGAAERRMAGFWELPEHHEVPGATLGPSLGQFSHSITHHRYVIEVREANIGRRVAGMCWKPVAGLAHLPLSTIARKALRVASTF